MSYTYTSIIDYFSIIFSDYFFDFFNIFRHFSIFFTLFLTFENPFFTIQSFLLLFLREHRGLTFKSSFSQKVLMHLSFPQTHET